MLERVKAEDGGQVALFNRNIGYFQESNVKEYWEVGFKCQAEKFSLSSASNTETLQDANLARQ